MRNMVVFRLGLLGMLGAVIVSPQANACGGCRGGSHGAVRGGGRIISEGWAPVRGSIQSSCPPVYSGPVYRSSVPSYSSPRLGSTITRSYGPSYSSSTCPPVGRYVGNGTYVSEVIIDEPIFLGERIVESYPSYGGYGSSYGSSSLGSSSYIPRDSGYSSSPRTSGYNSSTVNNNVRRNPTNDSAGFSTFTERREQSPRAYTGNPNLQPFTERADEFGGVPTGTRP
jgi:hypothetical protein